MSGRGRTPEARTSLEDVRAQVAQETDLWCKRFLVDVSQGSLERMEEVAADLSG